MAYEQLGDGSVDGVGTPAGTKFGLFGKTPAVQPVGGGGNVHTPTAGSTTAVYVNTTFDGSIGSSAYTIGDVVAALKTLGILAS